MLKADGGILGGAIWSKIPPVTLKSGMTSIKTVTETSPKHKTSAFLTLQIGGKNEEMETKKKKREVWLRKEMKKQLPKRQKPRCQYQTSTEKQ